MNIDQDYTKEQEDLLSKATIVIIPAFNQEWVIETYSQDGELFGRFNAVDKKMVMESIRASLFDSDGPPKMEVS